MLQVEDIHTYYGSSHVLHGVSLHVGEKEVVSLLGRNGAGKTTTIRSIMGLTPPREGDITFLGEKIARKPPHVIFHLGIKIVPQGKQIIPRLTVEENLRLAMIKADLDRGTRETLGAVYDRFPVLGKRKRQPAGHLSGGERQMLAIARALLGKTKLILLDEPTEGLAPLIVQEIKGIVLNIKQQDVAIFIAEQNIGMALETAGRHYIIDKGRVEFEGTSEQLRRSETVMETYLGIST
ncbi:MAG: ABC transporter ATP-binding protein [Deltaproteobacteria bacterium]|nr:ABC transporter ATP-binding protein [Deltaproteobacteria bacterium]MBW2121458.1 ABC transporter ATP-binding protein [Deltaproteobacteria bacterium]